ERRAQGAAHQEPLRFARQGRGQPLQGPGRNAAGVPQGNDDGSGPPDAPEGDAGGRRREKRPTRDGEAGRATHGPQTGRTLKVHPVKRPVRRGAGYLNLKRSRKDGSDSRAGTDAAGMSTIGRNFIYSRSTSVI